MNTDFAINTIKLRRILDKMPNATEAEIKAEYIKNGGLVKEIAVESLPIKPKKTVKKIVAKKVKEVVKKAVKKVTKKK